MSPEPTVEHDVDRLAAFIEGDRAELPVADAAAEVVPRRDLGDRLSGVVTLVRESVLAVEGGGDGGDALSGAVTLMRRQVAEDGD